MKGNKNSNPKGYKKTLQKEPCIPGLFDKPAIELAEAGVPLRMEPYSDKNDDMPTFVDKEHCNKIYTVENGNTYTIRLGIHSNSLGIGAMNEDCAVVCMLPTTMSDTHKLMVLFFIPEIYPAKFMDIIWLQAKQQKRFKMQYVYGSAILESNNDSRGLALHHDAIIEEDDCLMILQNGLTEEIPPFYTFNYDFLKFQIKIVFEE